MWIVRLVWIYFSDVGNVAIKWNEWRMFHKQRNKKKTECSISQLLCSLIAAGDCYSRLERKWLLRNGLHTSRNLLRRWCRLSHMCMCCCPVERARNSIFFTSAVPLRVCFLLHFPRTVSVSDPIWWMGTSEDCNLRIVCLGRPWAWGNTFRIVE